MANTNVRGIIGYNKQGSSVNKIFAAYENDIIDLAAGTGFGLALNTTNNGEFEIFLDSVFFQNYANTPLTYSNIDTNSNALRWSRKHVGRAPRSKYIKSFKSRLFLGNCQFTDPQRPTELYSDGEKVIFPSRVFFSDFFSGGELSWGLEWGQNGYTTANLPYFQLGKANNTVFQDFKAANIKVGDPLFITYTSTTANYGIITKQYTVTKVDSAYRLTVSENFPVTDGDQTLSYWVGSNWFDVGANDGDQITGFGENSDRLLIFKLLSLWFYTGSQLKQVKGAPGTSSSRSVINDQYGNTYYFHGSDPNKTGIYKYNGVSSVKISRGIDPFILGLAAANYTSVVVWEEGNKLRWYLGNLSATNTTEAMTNAVATLNVDTNTWTVDPIGDAITCATTFRTSNQQDTYCGTDSSQVLKMNNGNAFKSTPIRFALETKVYYPSGSEIINEYPYLQIIGRSVRGLKVKYKLWDTPTDVDSDWQSLGELEGDKTELTFPQKHNQSSGIQFRFEELGTLENDFLVEKISLFYRPNRTRLL